jgi:hypothetical protein
VDTFVPFLFTNAGRQPILTTETKFEAVTKGQVGQIDNIHTVHVGQSVFLPGCRILSVFDCVHMHWRWSAITFGKRVDPMVNPITDNPITDEKLRGTPYLASNQDINIIVVKYHAGEDDPDDPLTLVNNEQIATTTYGGSTLSPTTGICDCILATADHPIVWYVASSTSDTNQEPFFAHGFFVLDTSKLPNKQAHSVPKNTAPVPNTSPNSSSPITLNPSLIAQNQSITTNKDTSMDIKLRANDSSDPNANLTGIIARQPVHGTLSSINQQTGTVTYTPQSSYVGNDSFTFKVNDGKSDSVSVGTVSIEVSNTLSNSSSLQSLPQHDNNNNSNDSGNSNIPTANNASVTTNMNTPIDMTLSGSDANPNANLSAAIVTNPSQGKLSEINQTTGVATYTPQPNYVGNDSFTFKVNDGKSDSRNVGTVSINISRSMAPSLQPSSQNNISATANMASVQTYMNTPVDISLSASDPNPNANLTASIITQTAHGTLSELNQAAGRVTYTPNQNYTGQDSFTYKVNDGISDSNDARVYITVK